jgi:hypothetical protein
MNTTITRIAVAAAAATGILAAGCGTTAGTQPVRGQIMGGTQAGATVATALGGAHGICAGAVPGGQLIVKGPSGKLLATTTMHGTLTGQMQVGVLRFSTTVPAGNGPYTIDVVGVNTLVVPAGQLTHLTLTCG